MEIIRRKPVTDTGQWSPYIPEIIRRIYLNRGVNSEEQSLLSLEKMHSPTDLSNINTAVDIIMDAIQTNKKIMIAGDYDCDGATATSTAIRGLKMLGAKDIAYIIPDRFKHGYGLSEALVADIDKSVDLIITVDSGVSSVEGVAAANAKGIKVVVTDHHLPGNVLPNAAAIVNPNIKGDKFPSKALAGVGVIFYVLLAIRSKAYQKGWWIKGELPNLATLLPIVALGTVADLVKLDNNNRALADAGIKMIRAGQCPEGIKALIKLANKDQEHITAQDFSFAIAPRINAAGRMQNMSVGVETLLADDYQEAFHFASLLEEINKERKEKTQSMLEQAQAIVNELSTDIDQMGVTVFDESWHPGIVGLVASKLKESMHRPIVAFAPAEEGSSEVRGSCRSIEGFHLRDALAYMDVQCPDLMAAFGGHAMAAGLSMNKKNITKFRKLFNEVANQWLEEDALNKIIYTDGKLSKADLTLYRARQIEDMAVWGQGFPEPVFDNVFNIKGYTVIGNGHLKLWLEEPANHYKYHAIAFFAYDGSPVPDKARVVYTLSINRWKDKANLQLMVKYIQAV